MKKNIISLFFLVVLLSNLAANSAFSENVNKPKLKFKQEFNQLKNKKDNDIEATKQNAAVLSSAVKINYINSNFSFDLTNQDLEKVIKIICKYANLDYDFPNNSLAGTVSLRVNNKSLNEVVESIFANSAYSYEIKDNVLIVKKIAAQASVQPKNSNDYFGNNTQSTGNEEVQEIKLKYITYDEAYEALNKLFPAPRAIGTDLDEQKRKIKISALSLNNSLVLTGSKSDLVQATEIISKIDKPSPKVSLQCIVTVMDDSAVKSLGAALKSLGSGPLKGLNYLPNGGVSSDIGSSGDAQPNFTLNYSLLPADRLPTNFSITLDNMITSQKGKIISRPHAIVKSGKTAKLGSSSNSYLILTSASSYATTQNLETVVTGTMMNITPLVIDNNLISVNLDISHSYMTNSPVASIAFKINENKASSNLVVKNGETIVIGGLKTSKESSYREGLPFLRFIPFMSSKQNSKDENEVIFFITPYIVNDSYDPNAV